MDGTEFFKRNVQKWVRMFKEGRTETSEGRGGAHIVHSAHEERVAEIKRRMAERRDCTTAELAREVGIPATTVGRVVSKELKMVKKMCVWVPHLLTEAQVRNRIDACRNNLLRHRRHPRLLKRTLAIDETWVGLYTEPESQKRRVWMDGDEEPLELVHKKTRGSKWMLIVAMDFWDVAFWRLCPEKMTVTSEVYCQFLQDNTDNWMAAHNFKRAIIAHDNARPTHLKLRSSFLKERILKPRFNRRIPRAPAVRFQLVRSNEDTSQRQTL
nr:transposase [Haemonchus contortus]